MSELGLAGDLLAVNHDFLGLLGLDGHVAVLVVDLTVVLRDAANITQTVK